MLESGQTIGSARSLHGRYVSIDEDDSAELSLIYPYYHFEIGFTYQICLETLKTLIVCMLMGQPLRVSHMNRGEQHSATPAVAQLC